MLENINIGKTPNALISFFSAFYSITPPTSYQGAKNSTKRRSCSADLDAKSSSVNSRTSLANAKEIILSKNRCRFIFSLANDGKMLARALRCFPNVDDVKLNALSGCDWSTINRYKSEHFGLCRIRISSWVLLNATLYALQGGNKTFRPQTISPLVVSPLVVSPLKLSLVVSPLHPGRFAPMI